MTADRWTQAVRNQLGLGRLLPLGLPHDGAWITERAAGAVLRRAADQVSGVHLGALRIALADPDRTYEPVVPSPPSALPPGSLRVAADFTASADPTALDAEPLPTTAFRLRTALTAVATERIGLTVTEVDLEVTGLEEKAPDSAGRPGDVRPDTVRPGTVRPAEHPTDPDEAQVAAAALSVPGVTHLTDVLGRPVHIEEVRDGDPALPRRHIRVELAVSADERTVDVARAVRAAVAESLPGTPSVAALVTAVR